MSELIVWTKPVLFVEGGGDGEKTRVEVNDWRRREMKVSWG